MKNKLNRFGVTGWLFMLGLTVSAFVLINISDMLSRIQKEEAGVNNYTYSRIFLVEPVDYDKFYSKKFEELTPEIIDALCDAECCTSFYKLPVYINHQIDFMQAELIMNGAENAKFTSCDSKPIDPLTADTNAVLVGENMLKLSENRDGKILDLGEIKVPIDQVLKNNNAAKIDYSIYAFWETADNEFRTYLSERISDRLYDTFLKVRFFGDEPIDDEIREFSEKMESLSLKCTESDSFYNGRDARNYWYQFYNGLLLPICMIFGIFVCFSTSYLWIMSRKHEISIRKAYGYSNAQILGLIIKDGLLLTLLSICGAVIVQFIFCLILRELDYFDLFFPIKLLLVCAGMFVITVYCGLRQISSIGKVSPAAVLKEV